MFITIIICSGFTGLFILIYCIFFVPINLIRGLNDISYNFILKSKCNNSNKQNAINLVRRLRKMGENIPSPYPNGWYAIAESICVDVGRAISVACLGEQFVVFRTELNQIHVLNAYCPHMGANLGINGSVIGDRIECPFHHWQFDGKTGQCINIPYSSHCDIPKNAKVKRWISKELNDLIFIWYHAENIEEQWKIPIVKEVQSNGLIYHGRNEFYVNCHIQDIPENGADLSHFSCIHGANVLAGNDTKFKWIATIGKHNWNAIWEPNLKSHTAQISLTHSFTIFEKINLSSLKVHGNQIGPAYVVLNANTSVGPILIIQTIVPVERLLQKVVHRFYGTRISAPFIKSFIYAESIMFERDMNIWNHKIFLNSPCLVKEDRNIKTFRNWFGQFYSANSKTFATSTENSNW